MIKYIFLILISIYLVGCSTVQTSQKTINDPNVQRIYKNFYKKHNESVARYKKLGNSDICPKTGLPRGIFPTEQDMLIKEVTLLQFKNGQTKVINPWHKDYEKLSKDNPLVWKPGRGPFPNQND